MVTANLVVMTFAAFFVKFVRFFVVFDEDRSFCQLSLKMIL